MGPELDVSKELADYSLVRLNRKVWFRKPFKVRTEGELTVGERLVGIEHPLGTPNKITTNGVVVDVSYPNSFTTNLDSLKGNSGGVVINEKTGLVEGILVQGGVKHFDYDEERDCYKIKYYDEDDPLASLSNGDNSEEKDVYTGVQKITSIKALMDILKK